MVIHDLRATSRGFESLVGRWQEGHLTLIRSWAPTKSPCYPGSKLHDPAQGSRLHVPAQGSIMWSINAEAKSMTGECLPYGYNLLPCLWQPGFSALKCSSCMQIFTSWHAVCCVTWIRNKVLRFLYWHLTDTFFIFILIELIFHLFLTSCKCLYSQWYTTLRFGTFVSCIKNITIISKATFDPITCGPIMWLIEVPCISAAAYLQIITYFWLEPC